LEEIPTVTLKNRKTMKMNDLIKNANPSGIDAPLAWSNHGLPLNLLSLATFLGEADTVASEELPASFIFYDCETSGLSPQHDQILQFAAIRTDRNFNIIDELEDALDIRCNLLPGIVPSPTALLTTRVQPADLEGHDLSFYQMIDRIAETLTGWRRVRPEHNEDGHLRADEGFVVAGGPPMHIGYNSIAYDEEMLRHALFSGLHDPYLTLSKGATRADVMIMLKAAHLLHPGCIVIPETVDAFTGAVKPSFKLGAVCRANGIDFSEDTAHDALADVRATIALCSLIRDRALQAFSLMLRNASKGQIVSSAMTNWSGVNGIDERTRVEPTEDVKGNSVSHKVMQTPFALCGIFGSASSVKAVMPIGCLPHNKGTLIGLDLSFDPSTYLSLNDAELMQLMGRKPSPFVTIRANKQPILVPLELRQELPPAFDKLAQALVPDPEIDYRAQAQAIVVNRMERIRRSEEIKPGTVARIIALMAKVAKNYPPSDLIEEQLYERGFPSTADCLLRDRMRAMRPVDFVRHIPALRDLRLKEFALRRAFVEFPDYLPEQERIRLKIWAGDKISSSAGKRWRTSNDATAEIETLRQHNSSGPQQILDHLDAIELFLDRQFSTAECDAVGPVDEDDLNGLG
jgi:exodeoxyribonuclease I